MKTFTEIQLTVDVLKSKLQIKQLEHQQLNQIDMLSSAGSQLREVIERIKGQIIALEWVVNNQINGDL
jgi:hypothetical protein